MGRENGFRMFRMDNGQFWLAVVNCGEVSESEQGRVVEIVAKVDSYDEAMAAADKDQDNVEYPGFWMTPKSELEGKQACLVRGLVMVEYTGRSCWCVFATDLQKEGWQVAEYAPTLSGRGRFERMSLRRIVVENLTFAQAVTFANKYAQTQPGEIEVETPQFFSTCSQGEHLCTESPLDLPEEAALREIY
ncbi:hypothetical protein ACFLZY_00760 [Patescibacteria group bacterium]